MEYRDTICCELMVQVPAPAGTGTDRRELNEEHVSARSIHGFAGLSSVLWWHYIYTSVYIMCEREHESKGVKSGRGVRKDERE